MMMLLKVVALATAIISVVAADGADLPDTADIKTDGFDAVPHTNTAPEEMSANGSLLNDNTDYSRRSGVLRSQTWPNGVIPYTFRGFSPKMERKILSGMREIEHYVNGARGSCIKFVPRTKQTNFIDIHRGTDCSSRVGNLHAGNQSVSLGPRCGDIASIMHEFIHTIGFFHEHMRPDRDDYVKIHHKNMQSGTGIAVNFKPLPASRVNTYGAPYDFNSIMHYSPYMFSKDKSLPVLTPKLGRGVKAEMGQRVRMSYWDVRKIQRLYQCPEAKYMVNCNFASSNCGGLSLPFNYPVSWTLTRGSTVHGPKQGHSTGDDAYLVTKGQHGVAKFVTRIFRKGGICVDMFLFQRGPTSYLEIYIEGPRVPWQLIADFKSYHHDLWYHTTLSLPFSTGIDFKNATPNLQHNLHTVKYYIMPNISKTPGYDRLSCGPRSVHVIAASDHTISLVTSTFYD